MVLNSPFRDNPLLTKHIRSRLRRQHLIPSVAAVIIVCSCIVWAAITSREVTTGVGFGWVLIVQGVLLFVIGTAQVASSISHARESGILDFHRISPQKPLMVALGFVFGAPVREYILFACTLPFALYFVLSGSPHPADYIQILIVMVSATLLYHATAALVGLMAGKARNASGSAVGLVLLYNLFSFGGGGSGFGALTIGPTFLGTLPQDQNAFDMRSLFATFYGVNLPPFAAALIHQVPLMLFFWIALTRRMRNDRAIPLSRLVGVVLQVFIGFLVLGDLWTEKLIGRMTLTGAAYALMAVGVLLATAITPAPGDFANGVRRAQRLGLRRVSVWADAASNMVPLLVFAAVALLGSLVSGVSPSMKDVPAGAIVACGLTAAMAIMFFGSAKQYFDLRYRKNGQWYFGLCFFCAWFVPLVMAALVASSEHGGTLGQTLCSISPLGGIAVAANWGESGTGPEGAIVAVLSSGILAAVFLLLAARTEKSAAATAIKAWAGRDERTTALHTTGVKIV